ncbi:unnamed protein product [Moneuplotes crassus]|uniref:Mitochondrial carrier protein n=1 Tax=Euplotes crassus TaxID=5936 RepID=A0AAD2D217_EUPCR|nr:unnamed protein product [Moneuplotes crassus]
MLHTEKPHLYGFQIPQTSIDFTAGVVSGSIGVFVGHPLDTLRIRMQLSNPKPILELATETCVKEGVRGLYKGAVAPVIGRAPISGVTMAANDYCLRTMNYFNINENLKATIAGVVSGIVSSPICCPIEHIKIKKQAYSSGNISYSSIARAEGLSGLFRGLIPTLAREVPSCGVYFASYGYFKRVLKVDQMGQNDQSMKSLYIFLSGGLAGQLSWIACYPIDLVKSVMQNNSEYSSMMCTYRHLLAQNGYKIFFKGLSICLVRAFPVNGITLLLYEWMKNPFVRMQNSTSLEMFA